MFQMMFFRQQGKGTDSKSPTNSPSDDDFLIVVIWDEGVKQFMLTHIWYGVCAPWSTPMSGGAYSSMEFGSKGDRVGAKLYVIVSFGRGGMKYLIRVGGYKGRYYLINTTAHGNTLWRNGGRRSILDAGVDRRAWGWYRNADL